MQRYERREKESECNKQVNRRLCDNAISRNRQGIEKGRRRGRKKDGGCLRMHGESSGPS